MKTTSTVHQLRLSGKKVKITHFRKYFKFDERTGKKHVRFLSYEDHRDHYPSFFLDANGGITRLTISNGDDDSNSISVSAKCSDSEPYNRKTGVEIAIGRALKIEKNNCK